MKQTNHQFFDALTRAFAGASSRRDALKVIGGTAVAGAAAVLGRGTPGLAYAAAPAAPAAESCTGVLGDGSCPPDYRKKPKPGNTPVVNGCGGQGSDFRPPQGFGKAAFTPACNEHDTCYENCGATQAGCDAEFLADMADSCRAAYPGLANTLKRFACYDLASAFYAAVSIMGGEFYAAGQQKACECCKDEPEPVQVFCNCNDTCYDDVNVCLNECQTSLGCFTGICGPAEPGQCA
jgi:hypothetical protein